MLTNEEMQKLRSLSDETWNCAFFMNSEDSTKFSRTVQNGNGLIMCSGIIKSYNKTGTGMAFDIDWSRDKMFDQLYIWFNDDHKIFSDEDYKFINDVFLKITSDMMPIFNGAFVNKNAKAVIYYRSYKTRAPMIQLAFKRRYLKDLIEEIDFTKSVADDTLRYIDYKDHSIMLMLLRDYTKYPKRYNRTTTRALKRMLNGLSDDDRKIVADDTLPIPPSAKPITAKEVAVPKVVTPVSTSCMDLNEYNLVKDLSYSDYCKYLQQKYGIPSKPYFNKNFVKNTGITKTGEGLFLHHIKEDTAIMLCNKDFAKNNPYDYQLPENLVYCDYLEHLLLHIMICESPNPDANVGELVGVGGVQNFLAPELNDIYGGFAPKMGWKQKCYDKVKDNFDVYKELIKRFKTNCAGIQGYDENALYRSFNENFGGWSSDKNIMITEELRKL